MASSPSSNQVEDVRRRDQVARARTGAGTRGTDPDVARAGTGRRDRARAVEPGKLPVSELAFDKQGAASPFGEDITFPLPVDKLTFVAPGGGGGARGAAH